MPSSWDKSLEQIEPKPNWKAIGVSTLFNLIVAILSFSVYYMSSGNILSGFYHSLAFLGFSITISVIAWIVWIFREIKDKKIVALLTFSMIFTLAAMLLMIWQVVRILGALI